MDLFETYGITKIAKLLGISKEAIRKYENRDLLINTRDEGNRYRKYNTWDMTGLIQIRQLRKMGLSLDHIELLMNQGSLPMLAEEIGRRKEEAAEAVLKYQKLFLMLKYSEEQLHELMENREKDFWIEYRPPLYVIDIGTAYTLKEEEEIGIIFREWLQKAPTLYHGSRLLDVEKMSWAQILATDAQYIESMDIERLGNAVQYIPSKLCARILIEATHIEGITKEDVQFRLKRIREAGYTPTGEPLARTILITKHDGEYSQFSEMWVEIE